MLSLIGLLHRLGAPWACPVPDSAPSGGSSRPPARARPEEDADPRGRRRSETLCYVKAVLFDAGYDPLVTGDPEGLSRVIRAERPSLVLLDLMLPGTDGIELIPLTATEFDLLRVLSLRAGNVVTTAVLLRRKLGDDVDKPAYIFNEHGVGYRMPAPGEG